MPTGEGSEYVQRSTEIENGGTKPGGETSTMCENALKTLGMQHGSQGYLEISAWSKMFMSTWFMRSVLEFNV